MVTLEITSTDIKLMEVNNGKITKWASRSLEPGVFVEEVVSDPQALGSAIRQLMASSGIKENKVIASVSNLYSLSRIVAVSVPPEQPITEQVVLEATEAVIPISPEALYLSWQTIATGQNEQQILVIGIPRDILDSEIRALKTVGLDPYLLDLRTLALARVANKQEALVLNIDPASFDLIVVASGSPEVLRTTAWQPEDLSAEERAEQLISALELTVSFYNSRHPGSHLDQATPLFVTGQMSDDDEMLEYLKKEIEYPFEALSPPLEYPALLPVSQYAVNIGLAMKATAKPRVSLNLTIGRRATTSSEAERNGSSIPDLNLLPAAYRPWRPSAKQVYYSLAILAALGLLIPLYQVTTDAMKDTNTVRQKYNTVNSIMEQRKAELARHEPLQKEINQYGSIVAMGGGFVEDLTNIRSIARELGVKLQAITHSGSSISFNCEAPDYGVFRNFIAALEDSGRFTTPVTPPEGYPYIKGGAIKLTPKP